MEQKLWHGLQEIINLAHSLQLLHPFYIFSPLFHVSLAILLFVRNQYGPIHAILISILKVKVHVSLHNYEESRPSGQSLSWIL